MVAVQSPCSTTLCSPLTPVGREGEHLLEHWLVQRGGGSEGAETAGQQQPAPQAAQILLQAPGVVGQLGQDLVPQGGPALTPLHDVVTQQLLLPATQLRLTRKPQDLRREGSEIINGQMRMKQI